MKRFFHRLVRWWFRRDVLLARKILRVQRGLASMRLLAQRCEEAGDLPQARTCYMRIGRGEEIVRMGMRAAPGAYAIARDVARRRYAVKVTRARQENGQ